MGDIFFCVWLYAVHTFSVDIITDSWIPSLFWPVLLQEASKRLLAMYPGRNLLSSHLLLFVSICFPFCFLILWSILCPACTDLLLSNLCAARHKSHYEYKQPKWQTTHIWKTHTHTQVQIANQLSRNQIKGLL